MPLTMEDRLSPPSKKHRRLASERADSTGHEPSLAEDSITPAPTSAARTSNATSSSSESAESSSESTAPNADPTKQAVRRRPVRKAVNVACESCRKRKIKVWSARTPPLATSARIQSSYTPNWSWIKVQWEPAEMLSMRNPPDRVPICLGLP